MRDAKQKTKSDEEHEARCKEASSLYLKIINYKFLFFDIYIREQRFSNHSGEANIGSLSTKRIPIELTSFSIYSSDFH